MSLETRLRAAEKRLGPRECPGCRPLMKQETIYLQPGQSEDELPPLPHCGACGGPRDRDGRPMIRRLIFHHPADRED